MVFETIHNAHQLLQLPAHALQSSVYLHGHQSLNLVGGSDQVYNSAPGGNFDNGVASPWSHDYSMRAVDTTGLEAEGGASGPFACDSDGFACFVYNTGDVLNRAGLSATSKF
mmetsp:Transcript_1100/g.2836  ORF Transcript_1100/g.2836 Transcript_1100/m.2836 type:complete len:112 (-) Transcript_1100:180-515(-)